MKIHAPLLGVAAIAGLPGPTGVASAELRFDLITYDHLQIDFGTLVGFGLSTGILVNTGTEPISLADWENALHASLLTVPVGKLDVFPHEPLDGLVLLPGEAVGSNDPLLTALLGPGEGLVLASSHSLDLQMKGPAPLGTTQTLDFCIVLAGQSVSASTELDFVDLGGPPVTKLSAVRVSSVPSSTSVISLPSDCPGTLELWPAAPGTPHDAGSSSDLPVIGNSSFGVRVSGTVLTAYALGLAFDQGALPFAGCTIHLGLTGGLAVLPGVLDADGKSIKALPIPDEVTLVGAQPVLQAVFTDGFGLTGLTNALALTLGTCP
jgi:hypothetical protein